MLRHGILTAFLSVCLAATATAQTPLKFRWQAGDVLTYSVEHVTRASEVANGAKIDTSSKLNHIKRWQVVAVDAQGVATLQLSLKTLRVKIDSPEGETLLFDSENLDKSTPQMKEQLSKYVNQPLALLRVDAKGKVLEVKECKHGPASRFESEPPFVITLAADVVQSGQFWDRAYSITLEPPQGTGEKYEASQRYVCASLSNAKAVLAMATAIKAPPSAPADQVPLLQLQPEGQVVFDVQAGRLHSAQLTIDKELKGHQGEGSSYRLLSTYTEQYVGGK
jgi:hypothetical protein